MSEITVTPLGTVSPYCKDNMNCPGFLIEKDGKNILLDCGSGITRLLNLPKDLENLIIIISHLHKDHYSDLASIGYASYVYKNLGYLCDRIKVYIPSGDTKLVNESYKGPDGWPYSRTVHKPISDFEYLMNFGDENNLEFLTYDAKTKIIHGDMEINFEINPHQIKTYSTKILTDCGSVVYSSDTGYKNNCLTKFAKDVDLLICESTFLKGQLKNGDNHLYAHEAALIASSANVKKLVLTHFFPEINKQRYVEEAKEIFHKTEVTVEGKKLILRRK